MKKNKISKNWLHKQKRDIYVRQSKAEGYRSRAVYKLKEINEKFKILKNGINIVDLGSAPGSWSQFVSRNFKKSKILSIDLNISLSIKGSGKLSKISGFKNKSTWSLEIFLVFNNLATIRERLWRWANISDSRSSTSLSFQILPKIEVVEYNLDYILINTDNYYFRNYEIQIFYFQYNFI